MSLGGSGVSIGGIRSLRVGYILFFFERFNLFPNIALPTWWQLKYFLFSPLLGEMIQFDEHIFQTG